MKRKNKYTDHLDEIVMAARKPRTSSHSLPLPGKHWIYRATLLLMVTLALALFIMSKAENPAAIKLRTGIADAVTPLLVVVASPVEAVRDVGVWVSEMMALREENIRLKNENIRLLGWQAAAHDLQTENDSLRVMLRVAPSQKRSYVTARIVSDLGGPYVHAALINAGSGQGVKKDQAVISENGLIGRVIESGQSSARVLLLSDINSRVPVVSENTREKSILIGTGDSLPVLSYLAAGSAIGVGERIVTSGDGGVFPPGIPVGVVAGDDKGVVSVRPFADPAKTVFISAVDYQF